MPTKIRSRIMQPRIYTYRITFEEVPYYYYGVKKEKYLNEEYWGSPIRNKWCWELYTPKKQILQIFPYTDEGWVKANEIEQRLIRPVYNTDKWCLNANCGGTLSLKMRSENGKKGGKIISNIHKQNGTGIYGIPYEEKIQICRKGGKVGGKKIKELGLGIYALTPEQRIENGRKYGKKGANTTTSQKWQCLETGFIANPGNLTRYQRARNIDTSKRIRIE